ncbi:hypothetical protein QTP88_013230 [Uroleucon formosanum]
MSVKFIRLNVLSSWFTLKGICSNIVDKSNCNFNKTSYKDLFLKCGGLLFQTFKNQVSRLISGFCNSDLNPK